MPSLRFRRWNQFHLQQNIYPERLRAVLMGGLNAPEVAALSPGTIGLIHGFLGGLEIMYADGSISPLGDRLKRMATERPGLLAEAVHVWLCTNAWEVGQARQRFALSYRVVRDLLYDVAQTGTVTYDRASLLADSRTRLISESGLSESQVAFSQNSINGAVFWLNGLQATPVTPGHKTFTSTRRTVVPPDTLLWFVSFLKNGSPVILSAFAEESSTSFFARHCFATDTTIGTLLAECGIEGDTVADSVAKLRDTREIGSL